jgi:hypothetical protein
MKRFGNSWRDTPGIAAVFGVIGLFTMLVALMFARSDLTWVERGLWVAAIGLVPVLIGMLAVLPTCLFEIVIDDAHITHRFLGRHVLSRKAIAELRSVEIAAGLWGAKLTFRDGSAIHFFGAHLGILAELRDHLKQVAPAGVRFD